MHSQTDIFDHDSRGNIFALREISQGYNNLSAKILLDKTAEFKKNYLNSVPEPQNEIANSKIAATLPNGVSNSVKFAMADDSDPVATLTELRRLVLGTMPALNEARMEEIVKILEEFDQATQTSFTDLARHVADQSALCDKLAQTVADLSTELRQVAENSEAEIKRLELEAASRHGEVVSFLTQRVDTTEKSLNTISHATHENKSVLQDVTDHLCQLENQIAQRNKEIFATVETRMNMVEANLDFAQDQQKEAFAGSISDIANRLRALRDRSNYRT